MHLNVCSCNCWCNPFQWRIAHVLQSACTDRAKHDRKLMGDSAKHLWAWLDFWHAFNGLVMLEWWIQSQDDENPKHQSMDMHLFGKIQAAKDRTRFLWPTRLAGPRSHKFSLMVWSLTYRHSLIGAIWPSKPYTHTDMMIPLVISILSYLWSPMIPLLSKYHMYNRWWERVTGIGQA